MIKPGIVFLLLFFFLPVCADAQQNDSLQRVKDSLHISDSILTALPVIEKKTSALENILKENIFLNSAAPPETVIQNTRKFVSKDSLFYLLSFLLLMLGILRVSFPRYFSNLVRVFFNTSLRQSQLTDQLLQAKLPSLLYNLFFVVISGWYLYLLLNFFQKIPDNSWKILGLCILSLLLIYLVKFTTLKFAGWITGYKQEVESYIFIVFLINKIIALFLVPVVIIVAFSKNDLANVTIIISYIIIILMLLMRFFRSYGLLQTRLKVSGFHFFLYLVGVELLPLLLIYKAAEVIITKNL